MATVKVKFRPSSIDGREGRIYYQIIHERKTRHYPTGYPLSPSEWDECRSAVICHQSSDRYSYLLSLRERIKSDLDRLHRIIHVFEESGNPYSAESIIERFKRSVSEISFFNEIEKSVIRLMQNGQTRTYARPTSATATSPTVAARPASS